MANSDRNDASLDRRHLLQFNQERIEQAYVKAVQQGIKEPVVAVIDLHDRMGFKLASYLDEKKAKQLLRKCRQQGTIPTFIVAIPRQSAIDVLGRMTLSGRAALAAPTPSSMFYAVSIAAGGNNYALMNVPDHQGEKS